MNGKTPIIAMLLVAASSMASAATSPSANGVWMRGDGNARVRIGPCGGKLCATNLWIKDTSKGESVGDKLVMSVKPNSATELKGQAYDAKRHLTYSMTITVSQNQLSTRGCIIGGLVCNTMNWSRVN
jgi:uncharacterized protein (DUF2147 family)